MSGYEVVRQGVDVAGRTWHIESLKDRQQFHDPGGEYEAAGVVPSAWPLFGVLWPAGLMLAEYMTHYPIAGLRILEAGCGLGLASLVIHARGGSVIASDIHPLAGEFLAKNAELNGLTPPPFEVIDWGRDIGGSEFDLIIGSDLLYERDQAEMLAGFIDLRCAPGGSVILTDPGRGQVGRFNRLMAQNDFEASERFEGKSRLVCYSRST